MSNFWSRRLAATGSQPPAPQPPQTTSARPWWDPTPAAAPAPQQPSQGPAEPNLAAHLAKAPSSRETDRCGGCGSANYGRPAGTSVRARCYDCGWPVIQSGSGGAGMPSGSGGPSTPAKQIHDGSSNFNPHNTSAGRIG
ncbi:hypothetical protein ACWDTT_10405 [Streptosporangium sandarakinum]